MTLRRQTLAALLICMVAALVSVQVHAERIKDISSIAGVRSNQLVG